MCKGGFDSEFTLKVVTTKSEQSEASFNVENATDGIINWLVLLFNYS